MASDEGLTPLNVFLVEQRPRLAIYWSWCYKQCYWLCNKFSQLLEKSFDIYMQLKDLSFLKTPTVEDLASCSETQNWAEAPIRCISFHPQSFEMALLTNDDKLQILEEKLTKTICLRHNEQQHVSCVAWRPFLRAQLAVGCAAGICLWQKKQTADTMRLRNMACAASYQMQLLSDREQLYVTSIQWNRDGTILASSALGTSYIFLWEPDRRLLLHLLSASCIHNKSYRLLKYNPDFTWLLCIRNGNGATAWNISATQWRQNWLRVEHYIQTADWSPCGNYFLFVPKGTSLVYYGSPDGSIFLQSQPKWELGLLADLEKVICCEQFLRCDQIQAIAVDPANVYFAVIFKGQPFVLICLLVSKHRKPSCLMPLDLIFSQEDGVMNVYPTCMSFSWSKGEKRMLAIAWSSGRVQRRVYYALNAEEAEKLKESSCMEDLVVAASRTS